MFQATTAGTLTTQSSFKKKVHICYDSVDFNSDADINVLVQIEPSSINNSCSVICEKFNPFDLILYWDEKFSHLSNSKKFIFGTCWINWEEYVENKSRNISFICSDKLWTKGHILRREVWNYLNSGPDLNGFNLIKHMSPPRKDNKNFLFESSMFHIVVENESLNNWITEKVIDCFASKTIPILWGAPNIGEYFNTDSILSFNNFSGLKHILSSLDKDFYLSNMHSVKENYEKSRDYWDFHKRVENEINLYIG